MNTAKLRTLKPKKLNESGFDHVLVVVLFVALFAIVGTWFLLQSHAATTSFQYKMWLSNSTKNTGLCLDDSSSSNAVISYRCNGSDSYQQWTTLGANGGFLIKNVKTGQCVDDSGDAVGTSAANRVHVISWNCNTADKAQVWTWVSDGSYGQLKNKYNNGCINDPGSSTSQQQLIVYPCSGTGKTTFQQAQITASSGGSGSSSCTSPSGYHATPGNAQTIGKCLLAGYGWSSQYSCLDYIYQHESGWRYNAANASGAYGIPQSDPGSKMASAGSDWHDNARTQIKWGLSYIKAIYGTPCKAQAFWQSNHYYIVTRSPSGAEVKQ